ncbi:MAG: L-aspartate oxidase [Pseudomonadota bacterium]
MAETEHTPSIVIVGAGLAGLYCALKLAPLPVTVISPVPLGTGASSAWAQGGIAAAVGHGDTPEAHAADTVAAGGGLVDPEIALGVAREAGMRVADLLRIGVPFDQDANGRFIQSREAAHSKHRVVRVTGDRAGQAIMSALIAEVRRNDRIRIIEGETVVGLDASDGRLELRRDASRHVIEGISHVILATGGIGALYAATTNPAMSAGTGLALAVNAGAEISDAEFVQFHPTAIDVPADPVPLASEALRGDGAWLVNANGDRFMTDLHPDAELAPRDVVARAVFNERAAGRGAFLDCRDAIGAAFPEHFPTIYAMCRTHGIDPVRELIPVAPAEHYHMGGVKTDANGRTCVPDLWAIGEVAATGLHGANRLASNSLLETVVFAERVASQIRDGSAPTRDATVRTTQAPNDVTDDVEKSARTRSVIRQTLSDHVGVVRTAHGLKTALATLDGLIPQAVEDRLAVTAARLVATAALRRAESRGAHFRSDFPEPNPQLAASATLTRSDLRPTSTRKDLAQ